MPVFTGHPIEIPKTPGALRVHELLSIFEQANKAWDTYVKFLALGYSSAWDRVNDVLGDIWKEIEESEARAMFVLSILTAGVGGGLVGGVASGVLTNTVQAAEKGFFKVAANSSATNAASDAASQAAGSVTSFFLSHGGGQAFNSPGPKPLNYYLNLSGNLDLLFAKFRELAQDLINDLDSGKIPQKDGEEFYQYFVRLSCIRAFPSERDIESRRQSRAFEREASLCLWITWGSERDFKWWNEAWSAVRNPRLRDAGRILNDMVDIPRWDPILEEISNIEPHLINFIQTSVGRKTHIDLRKLKAVGLFSTIRSAQALSFYFCKYKQPTADGARELLTRMNDLPS